MTCLDCGTVCEGGSCAVGLCPACLESHARPLDPAGPPCDLCLTLLDQSRAALARAVDLAVRLAAGAPLQ